MIEWPPEYLSLEEVERCRSWIQSALDRPGFGTHTYDDVIEEVRAKRVTLWPFEKSALVTQLVEYPRVTLLNFWLAGGNLRDLLQHEPGIVEWARQYGCTRFEAPGRKGWARVMRPLGYSAMTYTACKEI